MIRTALKISYIHISRERPTLGASLPAHQRTAAKRRLSVSDPHLARRWRSQSKIPVSTSVKLRGQADPTASSGDKKLETHLTPNLLAILIDQLSISQTRSVCSAASPRIGVQQVQLLYFRIRSGLEPLLDQSTLSAMPVS